MRIKKSDIKNIKAEKVIEKYLRRVTNEIINRNDTDRVMFELLELNKRAGDKAFNGK
jgi:hypothetical protein